MSAPSSPRRTRGTTLVEALIAFALTAVGVLAMLRGESALRLQADITRERAEAVQLAQAAMEQMRAFASTAAFTALAELPAQEDAALTSNTRFTVHRDLVMHDDASPYLEAQVRVRWLDREGRTDEVNLNSTLDGADPALAGRLLQPAPSPAPASAFARHGFIPTTASDLGDGRSAWQPPGAGGTIWLFDNATGRAVASCSGAEPNPIDPSQLANCQGLAARLISGHVRFATSDRAGPAEALQPESPALGLAMRLSLSEGDTARSSCFDDALATPAQSDVHFACLIAVDAHTGQWSGRLDVQPEGWLLGVTPDAFRVCRYSADYDRDGRVLNPEHPLDYHAVGDALADQNFLVIRGDHPCPADTPVNPAGGHFVDANTVEQAPSPTPTPTG